MTLATVHDFFESKCPDGAGFTIHFSWVGRLLGAAIESMASDSRLTSDLPLAVTNRVNLSFIIDAASVTLKADWTLSLKLDVVLHLPGNSAAEIVRVSYELADVAVTGGYDRARDECFWQVASPSEISKAGEIWEPTGANLIGAGFVNGSGAADKQRFLEEIFYGLVWINKANLLDTILRAMPFPQVQRYLGPIRLTGTLQSAVIDEHLTVWTDEVAIIDAHCGKGVVSKPAVSTSWSTQGASGVGSPWDDREPVIGLYVGATTLLDWHAAYLAPAIAFRKSGGGFVRYDVDGALSLQRLTLTFNVDPNGGSLALDAGLRVLAHTDSFIDGPCGSRLSLLSATVVADASAKATIGVHYEPKTMALMLDIDVQADVDRNTVQITDGGLLGGILGELVEVLYKNGIVDVDTAFRKRLEVDLLNLSDFAGWFLRTRARVGNRSVFYPIVLGD